MKKLISIAVFAVFSASSAMSAGFAPSVGVSFNQSAFAGQGTEKNYDETSTFKNDSTKEYGAFAEEFASVFVEMGLGDYFAIGLDYVPGSIESPENFSREGNTTKQNGLDPGVSRVNVDFEDLTTVYLLAKSQIGVFAKVGYSQMDINVTSENAGTYKDTDSDGVEVAIGYERDLGEFGVRAELAYHTFDDVKADNGKSSDVDANKITVSNMEGATARLSLVKTF